MNEIKAFLFDLNGTMIDDMHYHISAWHNILTKLGATISLSQTEEQCYGKNGELLERIFPGRFSESEKEAISTDKETAYQTEYKPYLKLLDGLEEFIKEHQHMGVKMAIGSAAIMFNITFVLDGLNIRHYFDALISAEDVLVSKPDPETYLKAAAELKIAPENCLVFEDNPKGIEAAEAAGMRAVVVTTMHQPHHFTQFKNIVAYIHDYKKF